MLRLRMFIFLAFCGSAWSQIPTKGNIYFGYSHDHTAISASDSGGLNGWDLSLEGKFLPWIGLVADIDSHYGSRSYLLPCTNPPCAIANADVFIHNFLFGPRVSMQVSRFRPFAELLIGAGHVSRSKGVSDSNTSFVNALGGGVDYRIAGPVSVRGQLDWINTRFYGHGQDGVRFTTGLALHF